MQSDSKQPEGNNRRRSPDKPNWVEICTTLENTVLVFGRVTDFVSTSPWASNTSSLFETRMHEAEARLAHLRAAVTSLDQSSATSTIGQPMTDGMTPSSGVIGAQDRPALDAETVSAQSGHARFSSEPSLTAREREVAVLIAKGLSNRQIADKLVLVPGTVANHIAHILGKLDCANRAHIAAWAVCNGLLKVDSFG